jgi:corrinoid protein of di/trimethylamine methyltransferase
MADILEEISENLQKGKHTAVVDIVKRALDEGTPVQEILDSGLLAGMAVIGEKFKNNEVFVPEVLMAARAMNKGADILKPLMAEAGVTAKGRAVIGTVKGDLHDIGKNLVKMMMEGRGIEMIDLGVDVPADRFIDAAKEHNASVVCCSALLTTTMGEMKNVVDAVKAANLAGSVKVMVGGAPVTQSFCEQIGADSYAPDAATAAEAALAFF